MANPAERCCSWGGLYPVNRGMVCRHLTDLIQQALKTFKYLLGTNYTQGAESEG